MRKDPDNALYFQAQEMLESTNVYKKQVSDICYKTKNGEKSLILLVKDELAGGRRSRDKANGERINNKKCFLAIQNAMADYVSSYPAPASFKKRVRLRFAKWLQDIARKYGIPDEQVDEALDDAGLRLKPGERDTVIDTVKPSVLKSLRAAHQNMSSAKRIKASADARGKTRWLSKINNSRKLFKSQIVSPAGRGFLQVFCLYMQMQIKQACLYEYSINIQKGICKVWPIASDITTCYYITKLYRLYNL